MEWKGSGDGVSDGLVIENRTAEPKHIEIDCQTSKSTAFSEVAHLAPGEAAPYADLPDRMIEVNARAADGPKGKRMFDPEAVSGAIVAQVTDAEVTFETTTDPYDPATRDYTPSGNGDKSDDGGEAERDTNDAETADDDGEISHDAGDDGSGSTTTTATERSAASTTQREQRNRTSTTANGDARGDSSNVESSAARSQTTRSRSASETSARSESGASESTSSATAEDTTARTTRETDERTREAGRRSSPSGTAPSEDSGTSRDNPERDEIDEYLTESEEVNKLLAGDTRLFAVTDRRILDVTQSTSASGASIEEVESTLFSYVTGVDVSIKGPTTNVDVTRRVLGAAIAIVGLLIVVASVVADAGDVTAVGVLVGLILIGVGAWIYFNASERVPGGIRIQFTHTGGSRGSGDSYLLPEGQGSTAREVVRQLGSAHAPDPEPDQMGTTSASPEATAGGSTGSGSRAGGRRSER